LDRYLKQQASQDIERRACVVYVLTSEDDRLAGFYTLTQDNIAADDLPRELIKQLNLPRYERIGASLLGRLARDLTYKGKGVGELLLADALRRSLVMSRQIASAAVIVDAKDEKAHKFYRDFGFIPFPESQKRLFLPMATIERLYSEIRTA
jgi:GNAT superfamily N-acetyltransferase